MNIEQVQHEMKEQFERAGLLPYLVENSSQVLDIDGKIFAEIVLSDRGKLGEAGDLVKRLLADTQFCKNGFTLILRSKWVIERLGDLTPAYGSDGGLRAAVLIPVSLQSGSERAIVTVAVTKLAEIEFERILGRTIDLRQVAKLVIEGALRRGGQSFWDPTIENYLEVSSSAVPNISRLLKQTA